MQLYNTFWKIILANEIVIPTIQRDYAYGRPEASNILSNLLINLKEALDNSGEGKLHLAFVYGKFEGKQNDQVLIRNSENIKALLESVKEYAGNLDIIVDFNANRDIVRLADNVKFIPIDGQQRLTTLFLLHWYFAVHLRKVDDLKILKKFQYATRVSSKEFCELLCSIDTNTAPGEINSEYITNQEGYFKQWYNDPTVKNMLRVIDQINHIFRDSKDMFQTYYQKLTTTDTICFDFFDLENFQLTDELYVKMNSRGKKLTQFENFKAWLYAQKIIDNSIKKKIDIEWYDMFWQAQGDNVADIDTVYLQWYKNLFLADYLKEKGRLEPNSLKGNSDLQQYQNSNLSEIDDTSSVIAILRISGSKFLDFLNRNKEAKTLFLSKVDNYNQQLDNIILNHKSRLKFGINREYYKGTIEQLLFTDQSNLNWWQATFLYATVRYLGKNSTEKGFKNYFRVVSNLIFNTTIDSPDLYLQAIISIDKILEDVSDEVDILNLLIKNEIDEISFFRNSQKKEEKLKAQLILNEVTGKEWKRILSDAELHPYFYGQIGFILNFEEEPLTPELFSINFARIAALFSEEVLSENSYLLTRSLLTQGDCFYKDGNNRVFNYNNRKTLRDRNENWRKFFDQKTSFIKGIINHPKFNENNIVNSLVEIIDSETNEVKTEYYLKFIDNPKLFVYCKRNFIREYYGNHYLLNSTRLSGYFVELYTYDWYLKNKDTAIAEFPDVKLTYNFVKGEQNVPSLKILKDEVEWMIHRNYKTQDFILSHNESESVESFNFLQEAVSKVLTPSHAQPN